MPLEALLNTESHRNGLQQPTEVLTLLEELYFEKKLPGIS